MKRFNLTGKNVQKRVLILLVLLAFTVGACAPTTPQLEAQSQNSSQPVAGSTTTPFLPALNTATSAPTGTDAPTATTPATATSAPTSTSAPTLPPTAVLSGGPPGLVGTGSLTASLAQQVNPPEGYRLPVKLGKIGPQLLAAGGINYPYFKQVFQAIGQPINAEEEAAITQGQDSYLVITPQNNYLWLNFLWAVGLVNNNPILTKGTIMQWGRGTAARFASTGFWTLGGKNAMDLFASANLIQLTPDQQKRLEEVANTTFRPCCDNPTAFPDCNHGMALLALFEIMASQGATEDQMYQAAKYVNAYWFPQQYMEVAQYFKVTQNQTFDQINPKIIMGRDYSTFSSYNRIHKYLVEHNLMPNNSAAPSTCGTP